jgi:hypothetical protein
MERSDELRELTLQTYEALARGDGAFIENLFSREPGVHAIATDPNERWNGYETIVRVFGAQLAETGGFPIVAGEPQAYREGTVGWVEDQPGFRMPDETIVPFRLTAVFHKENDSWKAVQWHVSIGVPNEEVLGETLTTA